MASTRRAEGATTTNGEKEAEVIATLSSCLELALEPRDWLLGEMIVIDVRGRIWGGGGCFLMRIVSAALVVEQWSRDSSW